MHLEENGYRIIEVPSQTSPGETEEYAEYAQSI